MARPTKITDIQADILSTAMDMPTYNGERVPWYAMTVPHTWSAPLTGLIRRGLLHERRSNMFDVTPEGEAALAAWQNEEPPMRTYR